MIQIRFKDVGLPGNCLLCHKNDNVFFVIEKYNKKKDKFEGYEYCLGCKGKRQWSYYFSDLEKFKRLCLIFLLSKQGDQYEINT